MKLIAKKNTEFEQYVKDCFEKVDTQTQTIFDSVEAYCGIRPIDRSTCSVFDLRYDPSWCGFSFDTEPDAKHFKKIGEYYDVVGKYKEGKAVRSEISKMDGIHLGEFEQFGIPYGGSGFYFWWALYRDLEKDTYGLRVSASMYDYLMLNSDLQFTIEQDKE